MTRNFAPNIHSSVLINKGRVSKLGLCNLCSAYYVRFMQCVICIK